MRRMSWNGKIVSGLSVVALVFAGCREDVPLPQEMHGKWITSDARFHSRHLTLTADTIELGVGQGPPLRYAIDGTYATREDGRILYTVVYRTGYGEDHLVLYRDDDSIVMKNRPTVRWVKGGSER